MAATSAIDAIGIGVMARRPYHLQPAVEGLSGRARETRKVIAMFAGLSQVTLGVGVGVNWCARF